MNNFYDGDEERITKLDKIINNIEMFGVKILKVLFRGTCDSSDANSFLGLSAIVLLIVLFAKILEIIILFIVE